MVTPAQYRAWKHDMRRGVLRAPMLATILRNDHMPERRSPPAEYLSILCVWWWMVVVGGGGVWWCVVVSAVMFGVVLGRVFVCLCI